MTNILLLITLVISTRIHDQSAILPVWHLLLWGELWLVFFMKMNLTTTAKE